MKEQSFLDDYNKLNEKGRALAREAIKDISSNKNNVRKFETPEERFDRENAEVLKMVSRR